MQGIPTRVLQSYLKGCLYVTCPVFVALLLLLLRSAADAAADYERCC
jgi:hypothetical protein